MQEIHLDKNIKLLDCPGIIFDSESLDSQIILRNAVRVEQLEDPITPVSLILERCDQKQLTSLYKVSEFKDVMQFLKAIAQKRGKLKKGNKNNKTRWRRKS
jgi:nuclear GTP-binding protein